MVGGAPIKLLFSLVISVYSLGRHDIILWRVDNYMHTCNNSLKAEK